jgi:hypothetical protein
MPLAQQPREELGHAFLLRASLTAWPRASDIFFLPKPPSDLLFPKTPTLNPSFQSPLSFLGIAFGL